MRDLESPHQIAVAQYLRSRGIFFTISPQGRMPMRVAVRNKRLGYRRGTADLLIFESRKGFHGLFIEMKHPAIPGICSKGSVQPEQIEFLNDAEKRGYFTQVCYGSEEAIKTIEAYLGA